ncbi:hypothetical protein [Arthrobacter sp. H14]|uniref:hypothetical protein n=1 Tax=Arthrobacter sp. H14 TaxID=1312959 RepID=UPI00047923A5|nr:hypothetical protein [Arthrobacter sp. H14]
MQTATKTPFTTADTGEAITAPAVPADDRTGDGCDWIDTLEGTAWSVLPNWGTEGWGAGAWPLIILAVTRTADAAGELFGLGVYVEGDTTTTYYRTQSAHFEAITAEVFFHWNMGQADGPENLPATAAELPAHYRRPYTAHSS